jgi:hypothetical protein
MAGLKPIRRKDSADDPAADFCEQLTRDKFNAALLGGNTVDVEHDGASTTLDVAHGLQRAYQGAVQVCADSAATVVVCVPPETAQAAGVDIKRFARFEQGAATAMVSRFRVI